MNDLLGKIMAKKGADENMDDDYKNSKLSVLQALKDEMTKMMAGDLGGLKKVTVAAPDQAGLQEGLDKAKELMGKGEHLDDDSVESDDDDDDAKAAPNALPLADHEHVADDEDAKDDDKGVSAEDVEAMSPDEAKALLKQLLG